jgi:ADP-heptose:LPS heptosyltransferase
VLACLFLLELAAPVAAARAVICPDTGVAHLATALGTPSVVLFGPVPPSEWGPPPDRPQHVALWAGRRGDPHAGEPDPGLLALTPGEVVAGHARVAHQGRRVLRASTGLRPKSAG